MEFATLYALNVLLSSFDTNVEILSQLRWLLTIWPAPGPLFDPGVGPVEPRVGLAISLFFFMGIFSSIVNVGNNDHNLFS
jgi:hypothetical protein